VLTTPDERAVAGAFGSARGWTFPIVSHAGTTFAADMGYQGKELTFGPHKPGISTFEKRESGQVVRVATRSFGLGGDFFALWPMMEMLARGVNGWGPKFHY